MFWVQTIPPEPSADAGGPYSGVQHMTVTFDASASTDPNNDPLQYRWDFENDGTWDTGYSTSSTATHIWNSAHSGTVKVEVSDGYYTDTDTAAVVVKTAVAKNIDQNKYYAKIQDAIPGENQEAPEKLELTKPKVQFGVGKAFTLFSDFHLLTEIDLNIRFTETNDLLSTSFMSIDPGVGI